MDSAVSGVERGQWRNRTGHVLVIDDDISGAQPIKVFQSAIDAMLAKVGTGGAGAARRVR
jgi:hypothetical protein